MTTALAPSHPAEALEIAPESLEIANTYLLKQNVEDVANELDIPKEMVVQTLNRREVKAYIDQVFLDTGYNNRFLMRSALDAIIKKKFEEMDDAGVGSGKDILEILALSHKMTMDQLSKQIELEKIRQGNFPGGVRTQTNIQINDTGGSNYANLVERIIKNGSK